MSICFCFCFFLIQKNMTVGSTRRAYGFDHLPKGGRSFTGTFFREGYRDTAGTWSPWLTLCGVCCCWAWGWACAFCCDPALGATGEVSVFTGFLSPGFLGTDNCSVWKENKKFKKSVATYEIILELHEDVLPLEYQKVHSFLCCLWKGQKCGQEVNPS